MDGREGGRESEKGGRREREGNMVVKMAIYIGRWPRLAWIRQ